MTDITFLFLSCHVLVFQVPEDHSYNGNTENPHHSQYHMRLESSAPQADDTVGVLLRTVKIFIWVDRFSLLNTSYFISLMGKDCLAILIVHFVFFHGESVLFCWDI